ncbi:MAG: hypothetical protein CME26_05275 [Gemmatimonadetes bacterium]|nr:hypothetical protein [Gemmatimonadota bacterium]|tara:strand:- start:9479 stop:10330 length:852 start_codon:yes stop_codon:yes gene_type:complete
MDRRCLKYCLTPAERRSFNRNGYLIVRDALPKARVRKLIKATERVDVKTRKVERIGPDERVHTREFLGEDQAFIDLIAYPRLLPKVWGILGWNIHIYLAHLDVTPIEPPDSKRGVGLGWHQDTGRVNQEMETRPRPRLSVKVAYFLSDTSEPGRGNFHVIPGSQLKDKMTFPRGDRKRMVNGGVPILAPKGSAVIFDRRLWHSARANYWTEPRKVAFYGYGYRWLQARGPCDVGKFWEKMDPIERQLCRNPPSDVHGWTSPKDEDVPLKGWIEKNVKNGLVGP